MKQINQKIRELIKDNERLTFLVGAGCSVDPPSCLPTGRRMMRAIFNYVLPPSEVDKVSQMEKIRFEWLIEYFRDTHDPELKIIEFFEKCENPNPQHMFLAEMIKKGQFVMTTNFDFLIERALIMSGIENKNIICVITEKDYKKFSNPNELYKQGKLMVYKIHGSTKNIITNEDTKNYLKATLKALGSNKEGLNIFSIEPYKKPLFENISKGRSFIVIGYSGSDDFDIVPTLKSLRDIKKFIWIDHNINQITNQKIFEIQEDKIQYSELQNKTVQILIDIKKQGNAKKVYLIKGNTFEIIKELGDKIQTPSSKEFEMSLEEWLINYTKKKPKDNRIRWNNAFRIYSEFAQYEDALICEKECLNICKIHKDVEGIGYCLNNIGATYRKKGDYSKSLNFFLKALEIFNKLEFKDRLARTLNNIGLVFSAIKSYSEGLDYFQQALEIYKKNNNDRGKISVLGNIGVVYKDLNDYDKAFACYNECLKYAREIGDLKLIAGYFLNIGEIHYLQGNYNRALEFYSSSRNIFKELGDMKNLSGILINMSNVYGRLEEFEEEYKYIQKSLKICRFIGDREIEGLCFNNFGNYYYYKSNFNKALEYYHSALTIREDIEDLKGIGETLSNLGSTYMKLGGYEQSLEYLLRSLKIWKKLNIVLNVGNTHKLIGENFSKQNKPLKAERYYKKAEEIFDSINSNKKKNNYEYK